MKRRDLVIGGAWLGAGGLVPAGWAQVAAQPAALLADALAPDPAEFERVMREFIGSAAVVNEGLELEVPEVADNPSAVPVKVKVALPVSQGRHCEELILLAASNPAPLACRFLFTAAQGTAEAAVRLRLSQSQTIHALARMSDGRVLAARREVTISGSGCGM